MASRGPSAAIFSVVWSTDPKYERMFVRSSESAQIYKLQLQGRNGKPGTRGNRGRGLDIDLRSGLEHLLHERIDQTHNRNRGFRERPAEDLRKEGRTRRRRPQHPRGRGLRTARAERRGQDHHRPDPVHPDPARRRHGQRHGDELRGEAGAVRAVIGVTGQFSAVDNLLTGEENLLLMGRLLHLPAKELRARTARLLQLFDLVEVAGRTPATYSRGRKRRLGIPMTLNGAPKLH